MESFKSIRQFQLALINDNDPLQTFLNTKKDYHKFRMKISVFCSLKTYMCIRKLSWIFKSMSAATSTADANVQIIHGSLKEKWHL